MMGYLTAVEEYLAQPRRRAVRRRDVAGRRATAGDPWRTRPRGTERDADYAISFEDAVRAVVRSADRHVQRYLELRDRVAREVGQHQRARSSPRARRAAHPSLPCRPRTPASSRHRLGVRRGERARERIDRGVHRWRCRPRDARYSPWRSPTSASRQSASTDIAAKAAMADASARSPARRRTARCPRRARSASPTRRSHRERVVAPRRRCPRRRPPSFPCTRTTTNLGARIMARMTRAKPLKNSLPCAHVGDARSARRTRRRRRRARCRRSAAGSPALRDRVPTHVMASARRRQQGARQGIALGMGEGDGADAVGDRDGDVAAGDGVPGMAGRSEHAWKDTTLADVSDCCRSAIVRTVQFTRWLQFRCSPCRVRSRHA